MLLSVSFVPYFVVWTSWWIWTKVAIVMTLEACCALCFYNFLQSIITIQKRHMSALLSSLSPWRPRLTPMWHLWWTDWHWWRLVFQYFSFLLPVSVHQSYVLIHLQHRKYIILAVESAIKQYKKYKHRCTNLDVNCRKTLNILKWIGGAQWRSG